MKIDNQPRTYNELLDEYSLHQFIIRKGKTVDTSPEFLSYKRTYSTRWGDISKIIKMLEKMLHVGGVPFALIDGKKVLLLAMDEFKKISIDDLLDCIINQEDVEKHIRVPSRMFKGPKGQELAATYIKKTWKMYKARTEYKKIIFLKKCIAVIWNHYKSYKKHKQFKSEMQTTFKKDYVLVIQEKWLNNQKEFCIQWNEIKRKPRVEIHINSISLNEKRRMTMSKFMQKENAQISRIFAIKDKNITIIYVSPFHLSDDIVNYYKKIIEIGNIENSQSRLNFVVPENCEKLPTYFSCSTLLLLSPKAIQRIRNLIRGKAAYIVPGIMSNEEVKLSLILGVPLLSGEPQKVRLYSTKSGSRRIFNQADVPIPIGAYDIYDKNEFEITLTKLILSHPQITTWVFKIDDEINGRGSASLNIEKIEGMKEIRNESVEITETLVESFQKKIHSELRQNVQISMPSLYKNWTEYLNEFCKSGGVIEARPNCKKSLLTAPSISFLIEPNGNIVVIGSYDKLQCKEYVNSGCIFPQKSLPNMNLFNISKAIGDGLYSKGIIGYVSVDLLSFPVPSSSSAHPLFWGIDINCFMSDNSSVIYFFDFMMKGKLDSINGSYVVEIKDDEQGEELNNYQNNHLENRVFIYNNHVHHNGLANIQYKTFFHLCRMESISFDLENKIGSTFLLGDSLQSGILSILCISNNFQNCYKSMNDSLNFIIKQAGIVPPKIRTQEDARTDEISFNDILAKSKHLLKIEEKDKSNKTKPDEYLKIPSLSK